MNLDEILNGIRAAKSLPRDDDLRSLPCKGAFIYGRVSSQGQVRESQQSIREIGKLVMLAKQDGYQTSLDPEEIEKWLESIQAGADTTRVVEDGEVTLDCRDLGLSGSLGEDKRPGLADLWCRVETDETGAVYLTEGMSRLSRDRDRVLGYKLLKLLKERQCRVRVPEGVYNPAIPRDWDYLAQDIEDSAEEMKKAGVRLGRRRALKAAEGRHVGSPVSPGYTVPIEGKQHDGSYVFGKWEPYPPHQKVVVEALEEIVRQCSLYKAVRVLQSHGVVFPFFPEDLQYMETRSALRFYLKGSTGYVITYNVLKSLATNLKLIGIWQWRDILIENNHEPAVPVDLFLEAYGIAQATKPKGRAAYSEPMEWAGLVYCYNHDEPRRLTALNHQRRWACHCPAPQLESPCLQIADHFLTPPLTSEFLRCLDLTPHAQAVMEKLRAEVSEHSLEENQRRRRESELKARIAQLERYLGSDDPKQEETYWRLIRETRMQLDQVRQKRSISKTTPVDLEKVFRFLENLDHEWQQYPSRLRNRLLTLLVDRVELRHNQWSIEATIVWKVGLRQAVKITRPRVNLSRERLWTVEEEKLLRMLWPSSATETIAAAFPGRSWHAICQKTSKLRLKRQWVRRRNCSGPRWTPEEEELLRELYVREASVNEIADRLGRSETAIMARAHTMGVARPRELRYRKAQPIWEPFNIKVLQESSSPSNSVEQLDIEAVLLELGEFLKSTALTGQSELEK